MSVGTIVTIVLLMSVLVLGLFMVQNIFKSAKGAVDLTDQQLQAEIGKLFGSDEARVVIFPSSEKIDIKAGKNDAIGIGIRNVASNVGESTSFSYAINFIENSCGLTEVKSMELISLGKTDQLQIAIGQIESGRVDFIIPEGTPNCILRYRVNVERNGESYKTKLFTVEVK